MNMLQDYLYGLEKETWKAIVSALRVKLSCKFAMISVHACNNQHNNMLQLATSYIHSAQ